MTLKQLAAALSVPRERVRRWLRDGLPHARRRKRGPYEFDPAAVRDWLVDRGLAEPPAPSPIVGTVSEVANHFGVSERAVGYWLSRGCPGRPGIGLRPGRFDLDAIADWRQRQQPSSPEAAQRARLLEVRVEREQLRLDEARSRLVPIEPLEEWIRRYAHEIRARLEQLPDVLLSHLPPKQPKKTVARIRRQLRATVDDLCKSLADAVGEFEQNGETEGRSE